MNFALDNEPIFCALDLELTGFDTTRDEILEIGFVFFKWESGRMQILEQWDKVFNPSIKVPTTILGLTGISQEEIENGAKLDDYKDFLQGKLGEVILVGHNIDFDISFLKAAGIQLSGKSIDTLEVAQIILPTNESYNLEGLTHFFGISHKSAHRALADAIGSAMLLDNLLASAAAFPKAVTTKLNYFGRKANIEWIDLISIVNPNVIAKQSIPIKESKSLNVADIIEDTNFISLPRDFDLKNYLASADIAFSKTTVLLPNLKTALEIAQSNPKLSFFAGKENTFSITKFNKFKKSAQNRTEFLFILKIIVWHGVNWQNSCLIDLNLHGWAGQYINAVTGGLSKKNQELIRISDYSSIFDEDKPKIVTGSKLLIYDPARFEEYILSKQGLKVSVYSFFKHIKRIYNPENEFGDRKYSKVAIQAIADIELFFSVIAILLKKERFLGKHALLKDISPYTRSLILAAGISLSRKLKILPKPFQTKEFKLLIKSLLDFISTEDNEEAVSWIDLSESFPKFVLKPIDISLPVKIAKRRTESLQFVSTQLHSAEVVYFMHRFSLESSNSLIYSNNSNIFDREFLSVSESNLLKVIKSIELPAIVIFSTRSQVKEMYENFHAELKSFASLIAHGVTGGKNKVIKNFGINQNALLLASESLLDQETGYSLYVKTLIISAYPVDKILTDPYLSQLAIHLEKSNIDLLSVKSLLFMRKAYELLGKNTAAKMYFLE